MGLRPTQGDEKRVLFSNYCCWKRALPFVISTGAQRSGEICGVSGPSLGMYLYRVPFHSYSCRKRRPPLCHLDRSAA